MASIRRLSSLGERRAALTTFALCAALSGVAGAIVALALVAAHRVVYGPGYLGLWVLVTAGVATFAARRAVARARTYQIGAAIDDDAFSAVPLSLVRRAKDGYRLRVAPGFTGRIQGERAPIAVESLAIAGAVEVPFPAGSRAELCLGPATFALRNIPAEGRAPALPDGVVRRLARRALLPLELAALGSLLCAVPAGAQISEVDMRSVIPAHATPWEIEKLLRAEAQTQARSLHRCFDVLPISCQRNGYVGVGLSLSREGEIRSQWIARSTFGEDCPVNACMSDVVSTWFFEPMPEPMKVILPVQVLRTERPLPFGPARAAADLERDQERVGRQREKSARTEINLTDAEPEKEKEKEKETDEDPAAPGDPFPRSEPHLSLRVLAVGDRA